MNSRNKYKNIESVSKRLEESWLKSKGLLTEAASSEAVATAGKEKRKTGSMAVSTAGGNGPNGPTPPPNSGTGKRNTGSMAMDQDTLIPPTSRKGPYADLFISPHSTILELTDAWGESQDLEDMPTKIELINNETNNPQNLNYSYIGNTRLTDFSGIIYFASRIDNQIKIIGLDVEGGNGKYIDDLTDPNYYFGKNAIDKTGYRTFDVTTCEFEEMRVGMYDDKRYFKIVKID